MGMKTNPAERNALHRIFAYLFVSPPDISNIALLRRAKWPTFGMPCIKAIVRLAGKFMVHRRWIVAEFFVVCHKRHLCDSFCGKGIFMHGVVISLPLPRLFCAKNCEKQMQTPTRM